MERTKERLEGGHNILYQIFIGNQEDKKNNGLNTIFILKK